MMTTTATASRTTNPYNFYDGLTPTDKLQLIQITHFIHVHHSNLGLTPHDLLTPIEESLITRCGKPYTNLLNHITLPVEATLQQLYEQVEALSSSGKLRQPTYNKSGKVNPIHPSARPGSVSDSRGVSYVWIRGPAGVSTRFLANWQLLEDPLGHAEVLRRRAGRRDVFVSGWLVSRVESAERKAANVVVEFEKELEKMRILEEERRLAEQRKQVLEERQRAVRERREGRREWWAGKVVEGGRRRCTVSYVESDIESDDGTAEDDGGDDDFSVSEEDDDEEVLDGSDGDTDDGDTMAVGRVRVQVSERSKRAERRARMGNRKLLRSGRVMEEVVEDDGCCRRSKRLRGINA